MVLNNNPAAQRRKRLQWRSQPLFSLSPLRGYGMVANQNRGLRPRLGAVAAARLVLLAVLTRPEPHGGHIGHLLRQVPRSLFRSGTKSE